MKRAGVVLVIAAVAAASAVGSERYLWPLETERKLSSSFAEYREGHYHAGVDLRTFGRIGIPCRAIDDCEAVRLRVEPWGYGKALYVRLADGRTAVYAHLDGFCRSLDSLAYHWRLDRGRNSCDIAVAPGRFVFKRGDVVAYTGASGSLHPHLHFEMRSAAGAPLNPLETFYSVPDACPPILTALAVVPRRWGSLVDGSPLPRTSRFQLVSDSRYAVADTFELGGEFGFGVRAFDQQTRGSYRMGWYESELLIDGTLAYRARNSGFDYAHYNDVDVEYEEHGGDVPGRYLALFRKQANGMGGRDGDGAVTSVAPRVGAAVLAPGLHRGEIVVRDESGNAARGAFHFRLREPGDGETAAGRATAPEESGDGFSCDFRHEIRAEGLYVRIKTTPPPVSAPDVILLGDTAGSPIKVVSLSRDEYVALVPPERFLAGGRALRVRVADGRGGSFDRFTTPRILSFSSGARDSFVVGENITVWMETPSVRGAAAALIGDGGPAAARPGLALIAGPFTIEYAPEAFASRPRCSFNAERRAGLYRLEGKGLWRCVGLPAEGGSIEIRRPGAYAIMLDTTVPALGSKVFTRESPPSRYFKRRLMYVTVREDGSGVAEESIAATIDGRRVVCEYDAHRRRLIVPLPSAYPRGPARLRIEAADRAGNCGSAEYSVVID